MDVALIGVIISSAVEEQTPVCPLPTHIVGVVARLLHGFASIVSTEDDGTDVTVTDVDEEQLLNGGVGDTLLLITSSTVVTVAANMLTGAEGVGAAIVVTVVDIGIVQPARKLNLAASVCTVQLESSW